jgi:hypothetical protein
MPAENLATRGSCDRLKAQLYQGNFCGRYWDRTSDPGRVKAFHRTVADVNERGPPYFVGHSTVCLREQAGSYRERFVYPMYPWRPTTKAAPAGGGTPSRGLDRNPLPHRSPTHEHPTTNAAAASTSPTLNDPAAPAARQAGAEHDRHIRRARPRHPRDRGGPVRRRGRRRVAHREQRPHRSSGAGRSYCALCLPV